MKIAIFTLVVLFISFSCSQKKMIADPKVLVEADLAFSDYSVKHGIQKAFIEFADDSVVLLKDKQMPILGKNRLIDSYKGKSDSGVVLSWKPARAIISESGDLGYTYGFWKFISKSDTTEGTYLTVWKKDKANQWKYIADTGNQGLK